VIQDPTIQQTWLDKDTLGRSQKGLLFILLYMGKRAVFEAKEGGLPQVGISRKQNDRAPGWKHGQAKLDVTGFSFP
jgi:hypothetical protein